MRSQCSATKTKWLSETYRKSRIVGIQVSHTYSELWVARQPLQLESTIIKKDFIKISKRFLGRLGDRVYMIREHTFLYLHDHRF